MFNFFFKKNGSAQKEEKSLPQMSDLNHNKLQEGDIVQSMRYNLGKCKVVIEEGSYYYESLETGQKVSWLKMIDAATDLQKVKKLDS